MQILPSGSSTDSASGFFGGIGNSQISSESSDFMNAMQDALESVQTGDNHSVSTALNDTSQGQPLVESPYSRNTTDGVTYSLSEVCFSKADLKELRTQLIKEGASEESLRQFDILASQPDGATLAQVLASLRGSEKIAQIGEDDEQAIIALLGKIDPSGQLADSALASMRAGQGVAALGLIQEAFAALDPAESIEIGLEEALALGRGLGLRPNTLEALANNFGGFNALSSTAQQFARLLAPASEQFMSDAANREKLDAALDKTLKPIIAKARQRMEQEKSASALESRRVEQSRVLIDRTVQKQSREILNETLDAANNSQGAEESQIQEQILSKARQTAHNKNDNPPFNQDEKSSWTGRAQQAGMARQEQPGAGQKAQNSEQNSLRNEFGASAANAQNARQGNGLYSEDLGGSNGTKDHSGNNPSDSKSAHSQEWNELLGKVERRGASATPGNSIIYSMLQGESQEKISATQNFEAQSQASPQIQRQAAAQVEQGILSALRDGATRLDLQLHPLELGVLNITLIARNGEVSAQIRSEKSETAEMLSRQMEALRINLEEQGIKVDKIEVQVETQQERGQGSAWEDLARHNARQEEDSRREQLARLRNLAMARNNSTILDESVLEQPVHIMAQTARYAGQALHKVA